jgi:hypothetical protein
MDNSAPDYLKYSYKELLEVHAHIDREKFPERFNEVEELISKRENDKDIHNEENSSNDQFMFGVTVGELLVWVIVGVFAVLGYSFF